MTHPPQKSLASPLDTLGDKTKVEGFVVDTHESIRLHGMDVHRDLAVHYSFAEVLLLTLLGSPPDEATGAAFGVALVFSSPVSIAEAPAHAARIAQITGSDAAGVVSLAAIGLAEQARWLLNEHELLLRRLEIAGDGELPARFCARSEAEREEVKALRLALPVPYRQDLVFDSDPGLWPALLTIFFRCGLRRQEQVLTALVSSRLVSTAAEGFAGEAGILASYPVNLPRFDYRPPEDT
ncbi:MAG: hypothetical protein ACNA8W_01525 [Bradymonadaceae bacterium]